VAGADRRAAARRAVAVAAGDVEADRRLHAAEIEVELVGEAGGDHPPAHGPRVGHHLRRSAGDVDRDVADPAQRARLGGEGGLVALPVVAGGVVARAGHRHDAGGHRGAVVAVGAGDPGVLLVREAIGLDDDPGRLDRRAPAAGGERRGHPERDGDDEDPAEEHRGSCQGIRAPTAARAGPRR
jgi:hypothetical protein